MAFAADGRMFVWERRGRIWFVDAAGQKSSQPVLDISDEVGAWQDFGLLGVALHPNFLVNGFVFLFYVVDRHHLLFAGTPSYDPILGAVGTWAANRHELDVDFLYTLGTKRRDFEAANRLRYDLAYRYRLWPRRFGRGLRQVGAVLELNGRWAGRTRRDGSTVRDSGGQVLFLSPGLQYVTSRLIVEASLQLPVSQSLNGDQVETDFVGVLSIRVPFELGL